jgi:hypothetical protein
MTSQDKEQEQQVLLSQLEGIENVRRVMHEGQEYWSVVDVVGFLTDAANPSKYWHTMRGRMQGEGAKETLSQIVELPMRSADGRLRKTNAMNRQTLLRVIQSITSPKVEPLKLFLAEAGEEHFSRMEQQSDSVENLRQHYRDLGRDTEWITARILYIVTRNVWTSEVQARGVDDGLALHV